MRLKLNILLGCLLIAGIALARNPKKIEIKGQIKNAEGTTIYLNTYVNNNLVVIDSATLKKKGKFKLYANAISPEFFSLSFNEKDYVLMVLDSANTKQSVTLNADKNDLLGTYDIQGSKDSQLIRDFVTQLSAYQKTKETLSKGIYSHKKTQEEKEVLKKQVDSLDLNFQTIRNAFIDDNNSSLAVITAMGYLNPRTDLPYYKKIEQGLAKSVPNSQYHIAVQTQIKQIETQLKIQEEQERERREMEARTAIGSVAPELNFKNPEGKVITLESLRGNYVLIDFWASWCRPCRMENPNVVNLYNKYKDKGFTVYSVSLDRGKDAWVKAIEQDKLTWPNHVSDLKQWRTEAVKIYGFKGIPFTVLIDKEGKIIAKNLRGHELAKKLGELLGDE